MKRKVVYYNKLVRDKIPDIMDAKNKTYKIRKLRAKEYEVELIKKLGEEASGVSASLSKPELVAELADLVDVIDEVVRLKKLRLSDMKKAQRANAKRKGGFKKRLFMIWGSVEDGYKTNERKYSR